MAQASAMGALELESVRDDRGQLLNGRGWKVDAMFASEDGTIDVFRMGLHNDQPEGELRLPLKFTSCPPATSIAELSGSVMLRTGGRYETVVIRNALADNQQFNHGETPAIKDERLEELGIALRIGRKERQSTVANLGDGIMKALPFGGTSQISADGILCDLEWESCPVTHLEVTDGQGRELERTFFGRSGGQGNPFLDLQFKERLPKDAQIRLTVHVDSEVVRIPFSIKNIALDSAPESDSVQLQPGSSRVQTTIRTNSGR